MDSTKNCFHVDQKIGGRCSFLTRLHLLPMAVILRGRGLLQVALLFASTWCVSTVIIGRDKKLYYSYLDLLIGVRVEIRTIGSRYDPCSLPIEITGFKKYYLKQHSTIDITSRHRHFSKQQQSSHHICLPLGYIDELPFEAQFLPLQLIPNLL